MNTLLFKDYKILSICNFVSTILLFPDVPLWCFALAILFWLWRLFCHSFDFNIPSRTITGVLSFLGLAVIVLEYKTMLGKEPAASFIVMLAGLKTLEFKDETEKDFLVLLGFFLISSKFLFSYDLSYLLISIPIYMGLTLNLFPSAWLKSSRTDALKYLAKVALLATPMTAMMFIFFPRITKTLLEQPSNYRFGSSGFSDSVSPGSIARLRQNNEIALRLELFNNSIAMTDLYLRGQTLEKNNLMSWTPLRTPDDFKKTETPTVVDYKIILEAHYKNYIFTLKNTDRMMAEGKTIYHDVSYNFRFDSPLEKKTVIQSSASGTKPSVSEEVIQRNTEEVNLGSITPEQQTQINALLGQLGQGKPTPEQASKAILDYFSNRSFEYTLEPGEKPQLTLPEFLFKEKKGYCEHYASAMALLLRLLKIPARVVAGYHGGEFNPVGNFWTVRQKDSHAWVEFIDSKGRWVSVDPVAVVAPRRLELGASLYSSIVNEMLTDDEIKNRISGADALSRLSMWFDSVNYRWSTFLLEYDFDKQKDILKSLNLSLGTTLIVILVIFFSVSLTFNILQRRGIKRKFSELCFQELNTWAARFNLQKYDTEGPVDWLRRITHAFPERPNEFHHEIERAFHLWIKLAYQAPVTEVEAKQSLREIRTVTKKLGLYKI